MRTPGPYFEQHGGAVGGIFGAVAVMLVVAPSFLPDMPKVLAEVLFVVCAIIAALGIWGLFAKKMRPPPPPPPRPSRVRTGIVIDGAIGGSVKGNRVRGADTGIDAKNVFDVNIDENEVK